MFNDSEIADLLEARSISYLDPWKGNDEGKIDSFYKRVVKDVEKGAKVMSRIEWDHYGSGYASFVDAWFYREDDAFAVEAYQEVAYEGVAVLLSRLSPFFVMGQGVKSWHDKGGSSYMPALGFVDEFANDAVRELSSKIESLLEGHGLKRLSRAELEEPLSESLEVPTILSSPPFTEFDALFYWED